MGYRKGNKVFYVSPINKKGEEEYVENHIQKWDVHWKAVNDSFEESLSSDVDL
jgi:hypothetical protein